MDCGLPRLLDAVIDNSAESATHKQDALGELEESPSGDGVALVLARATEHAEKLSFNLPHGAPNNGDRPVNENLKDIAPVESNREWPHFGVREKSTHAQDERDSLANFSNVESTN